MSRSIAPGWYKDPAAPETQRYWDGEQWLGEPIPADAAPPDVPPAAPVVRPAPVAGQGQPVGGWPNWPLPEGMVAPPPGNTGPGEPPPAPGLLRLPELKMPAGHTAAPLERRLGARVVDILLVGILSGAANAWLGYRFLKDMAAMVRQAMADPNSQPTPNPSTNTMLYAMIAISLALWFGYEVVAVARNGQTLGKRLFGIKVVRMDGSPVDFASAFRRWAILAVPNLLLPCGIPLQLLDILWCTWDRPLQQCIHDKSARTIVVRAGSGAGTQKPTDGSDG